ncbi:helix-turn-helix transcriptional regulator [Chitinophaga niabensis]|uniref:helix-turn-helix domain-containing protein n=1 Tax=Chitinophaga niabensis TaxID=536979 RepID=UPI0031BB3DC0
MAGQKEIPSPQDYYERLGERLKTLRLEAGFDSAEAFAIHHKMGRTQYLAYERGKDLQLSTIRRLARFHKITPDELLRGLGS